MKRMYHIRHVPCDRYLRTLLDDVDPQTLAPTFQKVFTPVQRGKVLARYRFLEASYLFLLDGVEYHNSEHSHCPKCLERQHRNGAVSCYHQMVGVVIAHPELVEVLPLLPEPGQRQDGSEKGDCKRNASKRLLLRIAKEHLHLRFTVTEDALSANGPHFKLILSLN